MIKQTFSYSAFTALRVYALCKHWFLSSTILLLSAVPVGLNLVRIYLIVLVWYNEGALT